MRALTVREKWLLGLCFGVIFIVGNAFAARSVLKILRGSNSKIETLKSTLADHEMWVEEAPKTEAREKWLAGSMPVVGEVSLGKLQGDLIQSLQDDLFERKLKIEQQSLQDIVNDTFYTEVAVRLKVRGEEAVVLEWLTTLQGPEKFQIIKSLELELDSKSKEIEPQAECEITIARWYHPESADTITAEDPAEPRGKQG